MVAEKGDGIGVTVEVPQCSATPLDLVVYGWRVISGWLQPWAFFGIPLGFREEDVG